MGNIYFLRLESNDLGQILDGLRVREESWWNTAEYLRSGFIANDSFALEECNGEHEADEIARFYARIIRQLERQRDEQREVIIAGERALYLSGKADGQDNLVVRVLNNWADLKKMTTAQVRKRLEELKDEICDD